MTFEDVPEALTTGLGRLGALVQAEDALGLALLTYPMRNLPLPKAVAKAGPTVTVAADIAAKLALLEAFAGAGISKSELRQRIGKSAKEVRRLLDPMHPSKLPAMIDALAALGRRLVVGVEEIDTAA